MEVGHNEGAPPINVKENKKHIVDAFSAGRDAKNVYAYHGTGIETLLASIPTGRLPNEGAFAGEFYFAPEGIDKETGSYWGGKDPDFEQAKVYAGINGSKYELLKDLPFAPDSKTLHYFMLNPLGSTEVEMREEVERHGGSWSEFERIYNDAKKYKGVVLMLSDQLKEDFEVLDDEAASDQKKIIVPEGLPLKYVVGIEPIGDLEYERLAEIQEEVDNS